MVTDHPIFARFPFARPERSPTHRLNGLGVREQLKYTGLSPDHPWAAHYRDNGLPPVEEEYFEWIDLLEAVTAAQDRFVMVELGAGYGRWLVNAAVAMRRTRGLPTRLVGVEAEPSHFKWMAEHFADNGLKPAEHRLLEAAVAPSRGRVFLQCPHTDPRAHYGQSIDTASPPDSPSLAKRIAHRLFGRAPVPSPQQAGVWVKAMTLEKVLAGLDRVDLIDADVQGTEADIFCPAIATLARRVRLVHIGTHDPAIDVKLREVFRAAGWKCRWDYGCNRTQPTPYGEVHFQDGIQSWVSPYFA
jgi:FkbM family methyltransferase